MKVFLRLNFTEGIYWRNDHVAGRESDQLSRTMTKNGRQFFKEKNRVTPSVTSPGETNPSDAMAFSTELHT